VADTDTAETAPAPPAVDEPEPAEPTTIDRLPDDHPLVKAFQATKDELAKAKGRVKEYEDATKSEHEKLAETLEATRNEGAEAKAEAARLRAAIKHGLTEDDLELLGSGTPEEIEQRAEKLAARLRGANEEKSSSTPSRQPQERLRPGAAPDVEPEETDPAKLADAVQRAKYGLS
jgi:cytochrome c1